MPKIACSGLLQYQCAGLIGAVETIGHILPLISATSESALRASQDAMTMAKTTVMELEYRTIADPVNQLHQTDVRRLAGAPVRTNPNPHPLP